MSVNFEWVTTPEALTEVCQRVRLAPMVVLDTEFIRTRTYYPQLGLIQIYEGERVVLIDPLTIQDWTPFIDFLKDEQVLKVLHAGSEDLEVFLHEFGVMPNPCLDTQIVAAFVGHPLSSGFAALVNEYQQIELDKSESRTDWLARPLSDKQLSYAAADVYYLYPLAERLLEKCQRAGWLEQARNECALLCHRRSQILDPNLAYLDFSQAWQLRTKQLACLKLLAAWRLRQARERDLAVNFVIREESLWQVARYQPDSMAELDKLGLSGPEIRFHGKTLLALVNQAQSLSEEALPAEINRLVDHPDYKKAFKSVKEVITQASERTGLNGELLASRRQINQLLNAYWQVTPSAEQPELLMGWRADLLKSALQVALSAYTSVQSNLRTE